MSTELSLQPTRPTRNKVTGRFLPGNVPANKGKRWADYLSEESQREIAKGWKNLNEHRSENGKKYGGRNRKPIVAITDDGKFRVLKDGYLAAEWLKKHIGKSCSRENIGRCCRENASGRLVRDNHGRDTGKTNTDHRYMGIRFYFESDYKIWKSKLKLQ